MDLKQNKTNNIFIMVVTNEWLNLIQFLIYKILFYIFSYNYN
jgi:hypothetical protein